MGLKAPLEDIVPAEVLKAEVRAWAARIGAKPREIHVRKMRRKWGSCSSNGRLTLNTELFREPTRLRDEVIVHELLHLKYPNHGPLFRSLVRAYLGADGLETSSSGTLSAEALTKASVQTLD